MDQLSRRYLLDDVDPDVDRGATSNPRDAADPLAIANEYHARLTPAEREVCQDWYWRRFEQLNFPAGCRRATDLRVRRPMREWRQLRGMSLTDVVVALRGGGSQLVSIDTLRALEDGTSTPNQRARLHGRIAAALGIPADSLVFRPDRAR